jgi:hypothetical protein
MKARNLRSSRPHVEELEGRLVPSATIYTTNWSGYAVTTRAGAVNAASGSWMVPTALRTAITAYSSAWVGIDGANSNSVEQIGTDSDWVNNRPVYYAWYEMYPAPAVSLSLTVQPGDMVSATVASLGRGQFSLTLNDLTAGTSFTTTQTSSRAKLASAEWVQEAPSGPRGALPLANFGTIGFSGVTATVNGTTGPADNSWAGSTLDQINMSSRTTGALKAKTSLLTDSGNPATSSFSVSFVSLGVGGGLGRGRRSTSDTTAAQQAALASVLATIGQSLFVPATTRLGVGSSANLSGSVVQPSVSAISGLPTVAQPAVTVSHHNVDAADAKGQSAEQPGQPELLPPPAESPGPAPDAAPADSGAVPGPSSDLPGAALDPGRDENAGLVDGRWEPEVTLEAPQATTADEAPTVESPGLVLTLALGGIWGIATREAAERRRRQHVA